ncbi:GroES-like protein [Trametes versicolor FP-101664 SS1]|uniref:GroES-like protein n=1 Tax=Trametes versicolor (strain FP-101664) TaxID=717944 RepID=UPI00046215EE|nr:GroES-like protein [Trametes versicolor FP-101664 SS1]EIW60399.1 GroES-like protein [Trametes versicolor FP-101664 SS1]
MKALNVEVGHCVAVKDHPVPPVGDEDILVTIVSVSQNPTDWKHVDTIGVPGSILGCDFSGYVVKTGHNVTTPKVGDHIAGFVHGATFSDEGAYAEYVKTPRDLVWVVPENTLTHDQAATFGCAFWTVAQAFFHETRLGLVEPPAKVSGNEWVFIYGGSSAVGHFAIQLAKVAGYNVATTASPRNFDLVKSLGADAAFDYRDQEVVAKIKQATGDSVTKALDAISDKDSQRISAEVLAPAGGKVVLVSGPEPGATERKDVEFIPVLIYTALGRAFDFGPTMHFPVLPEDRGQMTEFLKKVPQLVKDGAVRPPAIKLWEGGLEAIPNGLQYMREGKVSAEKIVHRL